MHLISEVINYIFLFIALYVEVFFLITYFEIREKEGKIKPLTNQNFPNTYKWPSVSVIVPVWNEETTVLKTIFSLLKMNYPKDKLSIFIVDDGSTDNTWKVVQRFAKNKQIRLFTKANGGKHTAVNYALEFVNSDLVGCLDADSFVHPEALKRIAAKFEDPDMMAVTPSIVLFEPRGILGYIQKTEYIFGIFLRKVFSHLNALYVTPGPLSIFRRSVFDKIGNYRHAYLTEDMEIAMRMQKNKMKIGNVSNAFIYTVAPTTLRALIKQRLRWVYGFIKNTIDYRDMFFRPQYGNLGMVVLPAASFSLVSTMYFFGASIVSWINTTILKIKEISTVGFSWQKLNFEFFYINTDVIVFVSIIAVLGTLFIIVTSRGLAEEKYKFGIDSLLFLLFYTIIAPLWMSRAIFNVIFAKKTKWR
ncbi:MAG: glycosyltransferase family 2 protein [Candidatus Paceibacterota bacterium]|jgi:cellulose synthase/poly-beta-1,6-N-acetylglucosamine synthase-like glycosyltransferase